MGFLLQCDNKGCFEQMEPNLDVETDEVFCSKCGKEIKNVTVFAKRQMKTLGQTMKNQKSSRAFAVQCKYCKKTDQPKVDAASKINCGSCGKHLDYLPAPFAYTILQNIKAK